ncbi:cytochrome P450 [Piptocephalis cylindrospora]|uniref:Cytochrome P450 n=1 Tax=Piptocephalis cylindrospora TaxID=1907219 RepID=A0A4P9Y7G4_9FUNG|nr:cytochrome P450 [Piptocephalis cylindrospora]|eukprot:RKP15077.1 cytochrome P450 [Piptocephalis cylindrospora]
MLKEIVQVLLGIGFLRLTHSIYKARRPGRPGPPGYPIFGNLLQLGTKPHLLMAKWAKKYGDIYYLRMGFIDWMVVSTPEAMHDILSRQGLTFASRPHQVILGDILTSKASGVTTSPYGPDWNYKRRFFTTTFNKVNVQSHQDTLLYESRDLIRQLMASSEEHGSHGFSARRHHQSYALNIILTMAYGTRFSSHKDPLCQTQLQLNDELFRMIGPKYCLIDFLPFLRPFLPHLERDAWDLHQTLYGFLGDHFDQYCEEADTVNARIPNTLSKLLLESVRKGDLTREHALILLAETFAAGLDTSSASFTWLSLLLVTHMDVQKKAQEEVDRIVGRDRMPTHDDLPNLPYLRCILLESMRFRGPAQFSLPRATAEDTVYRGVTIRKGTWIMPSLYAANRVFSHLEDQDVFRPERWESNPKTLTEEVSGKQSTRVNWNFGAGRRVCPGLYLSDLSLSLAVANLVWSFTVQAGDGEQIDLEEMEDGTNTPPPHWRLQYTPRGDHVKTMLETEGSITRADTVKAH